MRSAHHTGIGGMPGSGPAHGEPSPLASLVETWPGPAAFVAPDGSLGRANGLASSMVATLIAAAGTVRNTAVGRVLDPVTIAGPRGPETYELTAIPLADGVVVTGRDISLSANMRMALADSRRRYKDLVEISSDFAWETDRSGAFVFVSPRGALGFTAEQLVGRDASFILNDDEAGAEGAPSPFAPRRRAEPQQIWVRSADGTPRCVTISAVPLLDADGGYCGARGLCRDVTEAVARDTELAEARNRERLAAYLTRTIRDEVQPEAMLSAAAAAIVHALAASGSAIWRIDGDAPPVCAAEFGERPPSRAATGRG
jgi:PAS domain S-box-containing protein